MQRFGLIFACLILWVMGCENKDITAGDTALAQGKYYEALASYQKAQQDAPDNPKPQEKIEQVLAQIIMHSLSLVHQKEFSQAIEYLNPLLQQPSLTPVDAYIISAMAYFYGFPRDLQKIEIGLDLVNQALRISIDSFRILDMPKEMKDWLQSFGFEEKDMQATGFLSSDAEIIISAFFAYELGQKILEQEPCPLFPIPIEWAERSQQRVRQASQILSWILHHVQMIPNGHSLDQPALPEDILIRGYGTQLDLSLVMIYLCLQQNIPAYLVMPREEPPISAAPLVLIKAGENFVLFDVQKGMPVFKPETEEILEYKAFFQSSEHATHPLKKAVISIVVPPRFFLVRLGLLPKLFGIFQKFPPPYFSMHPYRLADFVKEPLLQDKTVPYDYFHPKADAISLVFDSACFKQWALYKPLPQNANGMKTLYASLQNIRLQHLRGIANIAGEYEKMLASNSDETLAYFQITSLLEAKETDAAKKLWEKYQQQYPQSIWQPLLYMQWAQIAMQADELALAQQYYTQAQRFSPAIMKYYLTKGQ